MTDKQCIDFYHDHVNNKFYDLSSCNTHLRTLANPDTISYDSGLPG